MNLTKLLERCRSYRRFEQKRIPHQLLLLMIDAARLSNSAMNAQRLRYIVVESPDKVEALQPLVTWAAKLPREIATPFKDEQPTAFIACLTPKNATRYDYIDLGLAAHAMTLTACEAGVGSCMLGAIKADKIAEILDVDDDMHVELLIALGYPAHSSTVVEGPEGGDLSYYVDDKRDYYVPKLPVSALARFV